MNKYKVRRILGKIGTGVEYTIYALGCFSALVIGAMLYDSYGPGRASRKPPAPVSAPSSSQKSGSSEPLAPLSSPFKSLDSLLSEDNSVAVSSITLSGREWKISVNTSEYLRLKLQDHHVSNIQGYARFVTYKDPQVVKIASTLSADCSTKESRAAVLLDAVHQYLYVKDPESKNIVKFPLETIVEGGGDCEDLAILGASLMKSVGLDVALLHFQSVDGTSGSHIALGVCGDFRGSSFVRGERKYFFAEATGTDWRGKSSKMKIGELPEGYNRAATIILIE